MKRKSRWINKERDIDIFLSACNSVDIKLLAIKYGMTVSNVRSKISRMSYNVLRRVDDFESELPDGLVNDLEKCRSGGFSFYKLVAKYKEFFETKFVREFVDE